MPSPIALFVYNRSEHARRTLESLFKNDLAHESELFVFADGPKEKATKEQLKKIRETREVIREKQWCGKVHIIEKEKNLGLASSIISGVSKIINDFGQAIVLEDDLLLSKNFLRYMNDGLERYGNDKRIGQIAGYMYPVEIKSKEDACFLPFISSWGWGTWKRVWDDFEKSQSQKELEILKNDSSLRCKFNLEGSYMYFKMLKKQVEKNIDSWAIRFYLSIFMKEQLTLFPRKTLVKNIGMDGSGVHCKVEIEQNEVDSDFFVRNFPDVEIDREAKKIIYKFLKKQMRPHLRAWRFFKQYLF